MAEERRRHWNWYNPCPEEEARLDKKLDKLVERVMQRQEELEQRQKSENFSTGQVDTEDNASQEMETVETESSNSNNEVTEEETEEETASRDAHKAASAGEPRASSSQTGSSQFYIICKEGEFRVSVAEGKLIRVEPQEEETVETADKGAVSEGEPSSSGTELEKETENVNFGEIATVNTESAVPVKDAVTEETISAGAALENAACVHELSASCSPNVSTQIVKECKITIRIVRRRKKSKESSDPDKDAVIEGETLAGAALEKAACVDEPKASSSPNVTPQSVMRLEEKEMNESAEESKIIRIGQDRNKSKESSVPGKDAVTEGETTSAGADLEKAANGEESGAPCSPNVPTESDMQSEEDDLNESIEEGEIIMIGPTGNKPKAKIVKKSLKRENYRKNSEDGLYHCSKCIKKYGTDNGLVAHYQADHFQIRYKCDVCKAVYKHYASLWRHQRKCGKVEKNFPCQLCKKRFTLKKGLVAHQKSHKFQRATRKASRANVKVEGIGPGKKSNRILKGKFYRKEEDGLYHCTKCAKKYVTDRGVTFHYEAEHSKKRFKCDLCKEAVYKYLPSLLKHKTKCRGKVEKKFYCLICGEIFTLRKRLSAHQAQSHRNEKAKASKVKRKGLFSGKPQKQECSTAHAKEDSTSQLIMNPVSSQRDTKTGYQLRYCVPRNRKYQEYVS